MKFRILDRFCDMAPILIYLADSNQVLNILTVQSYQNYLFMKIRRIFSFQISLKAESQNF